MEKWKILKASKRSASKLLEGFADFAEISDFVNKLLVAVFRILILLVSGCQRL